jgi:hypothetical protein
VTLNWKRWVSLVFVGVLTACSGLVPSPTPQPPTPTITQTPTITSTIIWFPPTETPQPLPTRILEPTPNLRPAQGNILLEDAFSKAEQWITGTLAAGNIAVSNQSLTLAVQQTKASLQTYRLTNEVYGDFYLSVDASPSLCRGEDTYGVLFRLNSQWDYYRFLVRCDGYARVERVRDSQTVLMEDWVFVGGNTGALANVNLGVWAYGSEMRFFVNDFYLFTTNDPVFINGQVGFFARSIGEDALTVRYKNLTIRALNPSEIPPTPTWTPLP